MWLELVNRRLGTDEAGEHAVQVASGDQRQPQSEAEEQHGKVQRAQVDQEETVGLKQPSQIVSLGQ